MKNSLLNGGRGMAENTEVVDVVVIGAGPAGAAAAATLAKAGRSVIVLERRTFPRFHIGESMVPFVNAAFEKLGILDRLKQQGYVAKHGAEFCQGEEDENVRVSFTTQGPGRHHVTFQVERAHLDNMLIQFAGECGARVIHEATVHDLITEGDRVVGVRYEHDGTAREVRAQYVLDAGGRASKIAKAFRLRKPVDRLKMVAVFRHLKGIDEARNPGFEGDIQVGAHEDGWLWAIPIWPDTMSVGAVMPQQVLRSGDPAALFDEHVSRVRRVRERVAGAHPVSDVQIETDYCYYSDQVAGPGWFLAGDTGCFFDPIFSGGVYLATSTGIRAGESIDAALREPLRAEELQNEYQRFYKTGYDMYARLIYMYYEEPDPDAYLASVGLDDCGDAFASNKWVVRFLCGDFFNARNKLAQEVVKERRWDTFAPFERVSECPYYAELNEAEDREPVEA